MEVAQQLCVSVIPSLNDSRGNEIVTLVAVMTAVSTIAVVLRLIGRKMSAAPYGADDFLILVALILTYGLNINEIIGVHYGYGKHQMMLSLDHAKKFLLNDWTIQIIFASAISVTRLSLLVFYHRLFPVRRFTIVAAITGCIMIGWWIAFIFAIVFSCWPIASFWNKAILGRCINEHTLAWGVTGTELATNIIMLVLPIPWLWNLRLAWTKKLALIAIFMLGCFVCVSCIVRFPLLAGLKQTDASWTIVPAGIWIIVECNIGIASVCLPLMRPLISLDFSNLSAYLSFPRSRRTGSPFTDEETKTETSSGLPYSGKLWEKPYDGPHADADGNLHHILSHSSRRLAEQHENRYPRNRTHRSRIESYSPNTSASESPKPSPPLMKVKEARASAPPGPANVPTSPLPPLRATATRSSAPPAPRTASSHDPRRDGVIFNPLQAHPPSIHNVPRDRPSQCDPLKAHRPPSIRKPQASRHRSAPLVSTSVSRKAARHHRSAPVFAPPVSAYSRFRGAKRRSNNSRRLSAEEMAERWRLWYQGRGSEVGRGLWSLEILPEGRAGGEVLPLGVVIGRKRRGEDGNGNGDSGGEGGKVVVVPRSRL
ncbi:MAG: hypothetical protein LQ344_001663 [Seirophora lacunosa]|nr:MAG: hypothetical protein LQ344_001663 [Seirophora lacunosa]